ncbi:transcriptional regulator [Enterococcus hulanensis]|uniref:Transcriptional regulator n=1 Tax=Enterococcus hulanensis TaxID=2559929 RepID=A0ABU3EVX3_9ENTE|nr:transcriptional regulator [Enterococcus hulanensis]MDT2598821.1 transcriptional regulator [Enterococcus hulanensis]MDT2607675.1 transcriptional regulator [Enterococcus hulanensis]MDT2614970.1 transcriptional regulator [Enterococcus hulanensis]MDT2627060.1 transcriptional regulator [Enterococcus hulanensis]MDT2654040.1 transcriptional regulator [Enterococcus hulanensis]
MEKWKKDYLKGILRDYPNMEDYYLERKEKLLLHNKRTRQQANMDTKNKKLLISISLDRQLVNLERNQKIITMCLENTTAETKEIIELLYMKNNQKVNLDLVADQVFLSKRQVMRLRDAFFEELAEHLGI